MKTKLKNRRLGAAIFASVIVISSAVGVSAPGISDTKSNTTDTTISMPELTEDSMTNLLESSAAETKSTSEEEIEVTDIDSVVGLKSFVDSINKRGLNCKNQIINLNSNIVWNGDWEPIKNFNGTFNGNGYTISGINNEFIYYADENAEISNLNIKAEIAKLGNTGGVVSINQGTINNCTFSGTIMSDDDQTNIDETGCGGIAGVNTGRIENCSITEDSLICRDGIFCGGIVGINYILEEDVYDAVQPGIYNCTNYANISCTRREHKLSSGATGGIVGLNKIASDDAIAVEAMTPQIEKCVNYGNIKSAGASTGGIVGLCSDTKINECKNYGEVIQSESSWTGGIVGSFNQDNYYGDIVNGNIIFVNKCENYGFVEGVTKVGGIVGGDKQFSNTLHTQALMNMNECVNTGEVYTTGFGGGLSGYSYSNINHCINTGDVYMDITGQTHERQGENAVGGVTSVTTKSITDCINIGGVYVNTDEDLPFTTYLGGIAGMVETVGEIDNCYSSGPVTGDHVNSTDETTTVFYGGIVGDGPVSKITNCIFNNSYGFAVKSVASYTGKDAERGLLLAQMVGKYASDNMSTLFKSDEFKVSKNVIKEGVNYYLTPVLRNMPTPYELDAEKAISNASCAYLKFVLPKGKGYAVTPVGVYDPERVEINGDFKFIVKLDEDHTNYAAKVFVDDKEIQPDDHGVYALTNIKDVPIIKVSLKKLAVVATQPPAVNGTQPTTGPNANQIGGTATKDMIDKAAMPTGDTNSSELSIALFLLLITCAVAIIVFKKNKNFDSLD